MRGRGILIDTDMMQAHNRPKRCEVAKLVFTDPSGNYVGFARDGKHIVTGGGQPYGHIDGDSIISPTSVLIGHIRGGSVIDPGGKIILLVKERA